jgi:hypothetical protein
MADEDEQRLDGPMQGPYINDTQGIPPRSFAAQHPWFARSLSLTSHVQRIPQKRVTKLGTQSNISYASQQ